MTNGTPAALAALGYKGTGIASSSILVRLGILPSGKPKFRVCSPCLEYFLNETDCNIDFDRACVRLLVLWTKQSARSISHSPTLTEKSTSHSETFVLSMLLAILVSTSRIWKIGSGSYQGQHWNTWTVMDQFSSACWILLHHFLAYLAKKSCKFKHLPKWMLFWPGPSPSKLPIVSF